MFRPFLLALALLLGIGAAQAQTPFDSISQGDYGSWEFPEGDAATWGQKPASAADFGGQVVGNLHPYFLISTASQNDAPMGRAVWHGTAPFLNLNIMGGTGPDTQVRALNASGQLIGKVSGQGTLAFKQKCIFLGFDSVGKPFTVEVIDTSPTASVALDTMSFGDKPDTIEQQKVEEIVYSFAPRLKTPGLWVSVALDGEIVAAVAYGFKRASTRAPALLSDEVRIGSISKPVTGTVIGLLVDKGVISYDTKVRDVFTEFVEKCKPMCLSSTLGQLMTHTSGIAYGGVDNTIRVGKNLVDFRHNHIFVMLNNPANIPPGTKEVYAGGGMVACAMIDRLVDAPFEKYLQDYMIHNFGIRSLKWSDSSPDGVWGHNSLGKESILENYGVSPIGGYRMNILDLAKFGSIHSEGHQFGYGGFSAECFQRMHSRIETKDGNTLSGFAGWPEGNLFHDGNTGLGEYAYLRTSPSRRGVIAMYRNSDYVSKPNDFGGLYDAICNVIPRIKF